jgi:hypothetical protein
MSPADEPFLDILQNIEAGLKRQYEFDPSLTDRKVSVFLENAKIAVKKAFGFAQNEKVSTDPEAQSIAEWCIAVANERIGKMEALTLKEFSACIDKVRRSVERHASYGVRGYYEFIKNYV